MIVYLCGKCKKQIKNYNGDNDRVVLKYYIEKQVEYQGWYKIILCDECADNFTKWLEGE